MYTLLLKWTDIHDSIFGENQAKVGKLVICQKNTHDHSCCNSMGSYLFVRCKNNKCEADFFSRVCKTVHHFIKNNYNITNRMTNDFIFNRGRPTFQQWKLGFLEEAFLQAHRMNVTKKASFISFLNLFS
jgi:hypothetical protein